MNAPPQLAKISSSSKKGKIARSMSCWRATAASACLFIRFFGTTASRPSSSVVSTHVKRQHRRRMFLIRQQFLEIFGNGMRIQFATFYDLYTLNAYTAVTSALFSKYLFFHYLSCVLTSFDRSRWDLNLYSKQKPLLREMPGSRIAPAIVFLRKGVVTSRREDVVEKRYFRESLGMSIFKVLRRYRPSEHRPDPYVVAVCIALAQIQKRDQDKREQDAKGQDHHDGGQERADTERESQVFPVRQQSPLRMMAFELAANYARSLL